MTITIILTIALIYLVVSIGFMFLSVATKCYLCEVEDLIVCLLWIVTFPIYFIKKIKKALDKRR